MFDGNMFLPETGIPISRMDRSRTMLAVWLPDPLTVATWMLKSLTTRCCLEAERCSCNSRSVGDILGSPCCCLKVQQIISKGFLDGLAHVCRALYNPDTGRG